MFEIKIDKNTGEVTVEAKGILGPLCHQESDKLLSELGMEKVEWIVRTPQFYQRESCRLINKY